MEITSYQQVFIIGLVLGFGMVIPFGLLAYFIPTRKNITYDNLDKRSNKRK